MYPRFKTNVIEGCRVAEGGSVIAAVSGGIDSMVMLDLFSRLAKTSPLKIGVAHVNYGLRGKDSDADEALVRKIADLHGMPCFVLKKRPRAGANLQDDARKIRYNFFFEVAFKQKTNLIATAHNMNDQAETILLHLIRGSGPSGMAGMKLISPSDEAAVLRPLLPFTRDEIRAYAKERGIKYREDESNKGTKYSRNAVRHKLVPLLKEFNPRIVNALANLGGLISEEDEAISIIAREAFAQSLARNDARSVEMRREAFIHLPPAVRKRVLKIAFTKIAGNAKDLNFDQLRNMDEMSIYDGKVGSYRLPSSCKFVRDGESLIIRRMATKRDR